MGLTLKDLIIMGTGVVVLFVWLIIFILSRKYDSMFQAVEEKEFPLKELFSMGYTIMQLIGYQYKSKHDRKLRQEIEVVYGEKYAEFYLRITYAQQITYSMLIFILAFIFYGITSELSILIVMMVFSGLAFYYYGEVTSKKIAARSEEMLHDFAEAVAKLALLTNAGMILREAWEETAKAGDSVLYIEMQNAVNDMNNGISEIESVRRFGVRCIIPGIKKFSATIIQGMTKGNKELAIMLQLQSNEVWAERKQHVRRQGEKAASKLLIPMLIMFVGILIMIIVPIFTNF